MFPVIFFITFLIVLLLIILSLTALVVVGIFIAINHLILFFIQTLELTQVLVPSAILSTVMTIQLGAVFIAWFKRPSFEGNNNYDENEEQEEESAPLLVPRTYSLKHLRKRNN